MIIKHDELKINGHIRQKNNRKRTYLWNLPLGNGTENSATLHEHLLKVESLLRRSTDRTRLIAERQLTELRVILTQH